MTEQNSKNLESGQKRPETNDCVNFLLISSLQEMSLISIITSLCKVCRLDELNALYKKVRITLPCIRNIKNCWRFLHCLRETKLEIERQLALLRLPDLLHAKALYIIEPIIYQILHWLNSEICVGDSPKFIDSICWTGLGTVHARKTVELLFAKHNPGDIVEQFTAAAYACAENVVISLWQKMPQKVKDELAARRSFEFHDDHLVAYWVFFCNGNLSELITVITKSVYIFQQPCDINHSIHMNMCHLSAGLGNASAVEYFLSKIDKEKLDSVLRFMIQSAMMGRAYRPVHCKTFFYSRLDPLHDEDIRRGVTHPLDYGISHRFRYQMNYNTTTSEVTKFLLISNLKDRELQKEMIQDDQDSLIDTVCRIWPLQRLVFPLVSVMWNDLESDFFEVFVRKMLRCVPLEEIDEILWNLWHQSPVHLKKHFIESLVEAKDWSFDAEGSIGPRSKPIKCLFNDVESSGCAVSVIHKEDVDRFIKCGHPKLASMIVQAVSEDEILIKT